MNSYNNGDEMREALPKLRAGDLILYKNVCHQVFCAGKEQGNRIRVIDADDLYDCPIHGLQDSSDCPRC